MGKRRRSSLKRRSSASFIQWALRGKKPPASFVPATAGIFSGNGSHIHRAFAADNDAHSLLRNLAEENSDFNAGDSRARS